MKILNISQHDYASFAHDNAKALRSVGVDVTDVTLNPHKFDYPSQSTHITADTMRKLIPQYDIIQLFHSSYKLLEIVLSVKHERLIHHATGSIYRQDPIGTNNLFNPHVDTTIIALGEFAGMGAKNEHYCVGAVDTDRLIPSDRPIHDPVRIAHYPSNPSVKGTDKILEMMSKITGNAELYHSPESRPYEAQLELMQDCDIYIELFAPTQNGKPYGSWGITALEAAAMGKVVFTQQLTKDVYRDAYGIYPNLECIETEKDFIDKMQFYINNPEAIEYEQFMTRIWVYHNHSYKATGERLKQLLNI
jgi:hypothetical protein